VEKLFGIPVESLLVGLLVALGAAAGIVAVLAARNPILVKLGVRNVGRRRGRSALIVVGLMLGTTIVAAALTTGDTMSHSIRLEAVKAMGGIDEIVAPKGAADDIAGELGNSTGRRYLDASIVDAVDEALAGKGLTDGVTPAIIDEVAAQAPESRQTEPRIRVFAADPARMEGFSPIEPVTGGRVSLDELGPAEVYLTDEGAEELDAKAGQRLVLYVGGRPATVLIRDVVHFTGTGGEGPAVLLSLAEGQLLFGRDDQVDGVVVSNRGGITSGVKLSDQVAAALEPVAERYEAETTTVKQDVLEQADEAGSAFMAVFTTFGSFSIAAGILLIFLIFVMLAAERRGELGIARAIGSRRGHLVESFTFEGAAYDVLAALVGALLGAGIAYGMVLVMARAFGTEGFDISYSVTWKGLAIAYSLGVLLTLVVVALSAWRVSRMTISTAIRNAPEPPVRHRRRWIPGVIGIVLGLALFASGYSAKQATPLLMGISIVLVSIVPLARIAGVPDRIAFTVPGLVIVVLWMLPWRYQEAVFGDLSMNFSTWIAAGLMVVVGTVWTIMFNADLLLGFAMRVFGRIRALAPILRISMAYPLAGRFRTGTTLAMFTLVVFTLVTGTVSSGSFIAASANEDLTGGGYDVRSSIAAGARPIYDPSAKLGVHATDFTAVGSQSVLAVDARQLGTGRPVASYVARGLDSEFLRETTFGLGAIAHGYGSAREVWDAMADTPGLAVADSFVVPRRDNFNFAIATTDFALSGFYYDDGVFDPVPVEIEDTQTGRRTKVTVIGVLKETAPFEMLGLSTSQRTLAAAFPRRVDPSIYYFKTAPGVDPDAAAAELESAYLASGLEAESIREVVHDTQAASLTLNRLILAFMGLGLVVGVAALGVISARAVVERRQHIGVLRAVGFRRGMVEAAFLLESSFVALTAIVVGTALGLVLAWNIVDDTRRQPSWEGMQVVVPWWNLTIIFVIVYGVALLATLAPALRAARIRPAEALRYE
jgi:putative ABC transport system permease protein